MPKTIAKPRHPKPAKASPRPKAKVAKPLAKVAPPKATPKRMTAAKPPAKPVAKAPVRPTPALASKPSANKPAPTVVRAPAKPIAAPAKPADKIGPTPNGSPAAGGKKVAPTVVPKPTPKKAQPKPKMASVTPPTIGRLLDPNKPLFRKPLIPSGPKATAQRPLGAHGPESHDAPAAPAKSPFGKRELTRFREMLLRKRAELVGDVSQMEREALQGSGSLSNMPQHMAEQGSETYDTTLSLDLAAADRKLIKEIDDAIARIDRGTYGICEFTGKPIKPDRLEELPWARYSIEAARELERRSMRAS